MIDFMTPTLYYTVDPSTLSQSNISLLRWLINGKSVLSFAIPTTSQLMFWYTFKRKFGYFKQKFGVMKFESRQNIEDRFKLICNNSFYACTSFFFLNNSQRIVCYDYIVFTIVLFKSLAWFNSMHSTFNDIIKNLRTFLDQLPICLRWPFDV